MTPRGSFQKQRLQFKHQQKKKKNPYFLDHHQLLRSGVAASAGLGTPPRGPACLTHLPAPATFPCSSPKSWLGSAAATAQAPLTPSHRSLLFLYTPASLSLLPIHAPSFSPSLLQSSIIKETSRIASGSRERRQDPKGIIPTWSGHNYPGSSQPTPSKGSKSLWKAALATCTEMLPARSFLTAIKGKVAPRPSS